MVKEERKSAVPVRDRASGSELRQVEEEEPDVLK